MKVILVALLVSYLSKVEGRGCADCTAWFDYPICGSNDRCHVIFKNSCEMEMLNCMLPASYQFKKSQVFGNCGKEGVNKCKAYVLMEKLAQKVKAVEIFA